MHQRMWSGLGKTPALLKVKEPVIHFLLYFWRYYNLLLTFHSGIHYQEGKKGREVMRDLESH